MVFIYLLRFWSLCLRLYLLVLLIDYFLKNMFDVIVFLNFEVFGDYGYSRLFLLERFIGG